MTSHEGEFMDKELPDFVRQLNRRSPVYQGTPVQVIGVYHNGTVSERCYVRKLNGRSNAWQGWITADQLEVSEDTQERATSLDQLVSLKARLYSSRPVIVVHCGSTRRAMDAFEEWRLRDTLDGMIVLTIGAKKHDQELGLTPEQAEHLDILHLWKIELADFVRVFNVGGYVGTSTRREIEYAKRLGKPIVYLEEPLCQQE
jgi:hypothetical protein